MAILVGYGQQITHINKKPELESNVYDLSCIAKTWYDPKAPKAKTKEEILKRKARYFFSVATKAKTETTAFKHSYYFDDEKEAREEHQKLKLRLYDQLTAPLLKKLKGSAQLGPLDQIFFESVVERLNKLR